MGKREGKIEKALVARIKAIGGRVRKAKWIAWRGCPDRRLMLPSEYRRHLAVWMNEPRHSAQNPWVECKAPGVELEDYQAREHRKMRELGELILVIDSQEQIDRFFPLVLP
jgi:hypothetical protein